MIAEYADPLHRLFDLVAMIEGRKAEVALTRRPETRPRCPNHMDFVEQIVEKAPTVPTVGHGEPEVRRMLSTVDGDSGRAQLLAHNGSVRHIKSDDLFDRFLAGGRVGRRRTPLHRIGNAVELGRVAAGPQLMQLHLRTRNRATDELPGHHGIAAANTGKTGVFGKTAEFDRNLASPFNFVDRMRNRRIVDIPLVRRIIENDRLLFPCVFDPSGQHFARHHRAGRIIGGAEVDQVHMLCGMRRHKIVFGRAGHIHQSLVRALLVGGAGTSSHNIGIAIDRIDRIGQGHHTIIGKNLLQIARIALGSVRDKDLIDIDTDAARTEIVLDDGLAQKLLTLIGWIALEAFVIGHFLSSLFHRIDYGSRDALDHVADPQADDISLRVGLGKSIDPARNLGKEIAGL